MKAKLEVNEAIIKQAILDYFKVMDASEVTFKTSPRYDMMDHLTGGADISATVTIEVGDVVAH
jgi:hypothetical protein